MAKFSSKIYMECMMTINKKNRRKKMLVTSYESEKNKRFKTQFETHTKTPLTVSKTLVIPCAQIS